MKLIPLILFLIYLNKIEAITFEYNEQVEGDVNDLIEMVPFNEMLGLGMEYAQSDEQTVRLVNYLQSPEFRENLQQVKTTQQIMAEAAGIGDSFKHFMDKFDSVLKMTLPAAQNRSRRSPGDGLLSLVKEEFDMMPLVDIKQSYEYKLTNHPKFKELMDKLLSDEMKEYVEFISVSKPFQDTKEDLVQLGVPVDEIVQFITDELTEFFSLDHPEQEESDEHSQEEHSHEEHDHSHT